MNVKYQKLIGSELRHTGIPYLDFMNVLSKSLSIKTYFEIGTDIGNSLKAVVGNAVCVDPSFKVSQNVLAGRDFVHFFQTTSNEFFSHYDLRLYFPAGVDLAFLDGLHHFEALLMDFINTERYCHKQSVILLHDCLPLNERMAERSFRIDPMEDEYTRHAWAGDVWKLLPILKKYRPDIKVLQIDCEPTGLISCTNLDSRSNILRDNYDHIVKEFCSEALSQNAIQRLWEHFPYIDSRSLVGSSKDILNVIY